MSAPPRIIGGKRPVMGARPSVRRASLRVALVLGVLSLSASATTAAASGARVSLPAIERQLMCVTCKIPLNEAQAPQAARERAFVGELIARGKNEGQIKDALVAQYGPAVLALPRARGVDAAVYIVPLAIVGGLAALLAFLLPTWRRRSRARGAGFADPPAQARPLSPADAARLDADMARFD